jgi:hypothetical protein
MMKFCSRATVAVVASMLLIGAASAQTPAPTPAPTTQTTPAEKMAPGAKAAKPRTEVSLECSKQADAKKLHGEERRKFRSACKKTGGKS